MHGKIFSFTRQGLVNGVEKETFASPKRASTLRRSTKVTAARRARSRLYGTIRKVGLERKGGSVILQRFLPGGSIVVNTSKASSWTVLK